jgi:transcriptional regulator with XRE-family HTH domain
VKLAEKRKSAGLTQKALADLSGVSIRMIQHWEQGFRDINRAEAMNVYLLSKALKCNMDELLEFAREEKG